MGLPIPCPPYLLALQPRLNTSTLHQIILSPLLLSQLFLPHCFLCMFPVAHVSNIPRTLFLGAPESRVNPEMAGRGRPHKGEVQLILSQTTSCASCALPPPAWAPFHPELLPLLPLSPLSRLVLSTPFIHGTALAHTCIWGCRESRQVEGERRRPASGPLTLSRTGVFSLDRSSLCAPGL